MNLQTKLNFSQMIYYHFNYNKFFKYKLESNRVNQILLLLKNVSRLMGCSQSDITEIIDPTNYLIIQSKSKLQVNDMPNDQYHFKIFDQAKELCTQMKLDQAQKVADKFFEIGYIDEAIDIYQRIVLAQPSYKNQIEGLGCRDLGVSYYQWHIFRTYDEKRKANIIKSSPYDAMCLCYSLLVGKPKYATDMKKGEAWYRSMTEKYPDHVGLTIGYGNILYCNDSFDQAIKMYERAVQLKPDLINAYASIAMTFQYKRVNLQKANEYANKILEMVPSNPYADFILSKNTQQIDQKIAKLKNAHQKHPDYTRITNQIGICYGGTKKDYPEAIQWYKKCIEQIPLYASPYNNIGVNYELQEKYQDARVWYYKAVEIQYDYAAPHDNLTDIYIQLKWTDRQIQQQVQKYEKIDKGAFFWQIGKAFYNKKKSESVLRAIIWGQKSVNLDPTKFEFWNTLAISYDENRQYQKAIELYKKTVQLNPQYAIGYYNCAITYKSINQMDECQKYYRKAVEVNPRYSYAWNNLGNIYKNKDQYEQAVEFYQHAIQYNSTYTLALANLGVCLVKLNRYKEAFKYFSLAMQALPNDKNDLSQGNRAFLTQNLALFEKEGQKWKKTGLATDQEKQSLKMLIQEFQQKFKNFNAAIKTRDMPTQKIFNPQILEIIRIIKEDKFQLQKIQEIFELVESIFHEDEEYFHIIPLLIIEKFTTCVFEKKKPIHETEANLREIMKSISAKVNQKQSEKNQGKIVKNVELKLTESKVTNADVNLFKDTAYFKSYEELYIEVSKVNAEAKKSYTDFSLLVEEVRKKSNGLPGGISTKIPLKTSEQFKVMLRIMEKMFKKEINSERTTKLINSINQQLQEVSSPTLDVVVRVIMTTWNEEIKKILTEREKQHIETKFTISDLLRAKCYYNTVEDLVKAVRVVDGYCKTMNYQVIELDNRLMKPQTQDAVFKIRIKDALCEFQLAIKQDEGFTHLDHCVYEILRSPLGVIFGSYLFLSKEVRYPLTANCKDIAEKLANTDKQHMKMIKMCAEYVLDTLQTIKSDKKPE